MVERANTPPGLDTVDLKLLGLFQRDASLSTAELAGRVGISQSPCWRRLQRLRDEGYIKAVVAIADRHKLGFSMQIFAQLKMARLTADERAELLRLIDSIPEILECCPILGEMDLMLKVIVPDVLWYQDFLVSVIMKLPGVKDVHSIVTLAEIKNTTVIPLHPRTLK
jgi:Lrp/AsnC family transcriptional regulator